MTPERLAWRGTFAPKDRRPIYEWARDNVSLSSPFTRTGPFDVTGSRHFIPIFDALADDNRREVNVLKPVRGGGTLLADVWAPWTRAVDSETFGKEDYNGKHRDLDPQNAGRRLLAGVKAARKAGQDHDNPFPPKKTLGWQPTCECSAKALEEGSRDYNEMDWLTTPVPCTVLDPFAGSFTTCAVALELGRSSIGVELNPAYVKLGRERCAITPGLNLGS